MSEGKRPFGIDWPPIIGMIHCDQHREVCEYALALEAALVKVTEALVAVTLTYAGEGATSKREIEAELTAARDALRAAAPLIANIPAPQKEPR